MIWKCTLESTQDSSREKTNFVWPKNLSGFNPIENNVDNLQKPLFLLGENIFDPLLRIVSTKAYK